MTGKRWPLYRFYTFLLILETNSPRSEINVLPWVVTGDDLLTRKDRVLYPSVLRDTRPPFIHTSLSADRVNYHYALGGVFPTERELGHTTIRLFRGFFSTQDGFPARETLRDLDDCLRRPIVSVNVTVSDRKTTSKDTGD